MIQYINTYCIYIFFFKNHPNTINSAKWVSIGARLENLWALEDEWQREDGQHMLHVCEDAVRHRSRSQYQDPTKKSTKTAKPLEHCTLITNDILYSSSPTTLQAHVLHVFDEIKKCGTTEGLSCYWWRVRQKAMEEPSAINNFEGEKKSSWLPHKSPLLVVEFVRLNE